MSLFPIASDKVQLTGDAPVAGDSYANGVLINSTGLLCRAATTGGAQYSNGLLMSNTGQVIYVDATAGLPTGTQYCNGLPLSGGALCISTGAAVSYSNGLPFAANGAVAVAFSYILDALGVSAAAAYSLHRLSLAASLACRVRRSSDNAELNIGFTASGDLDTASLLAHVGSGNGFVTTWYDQSGNGRNAAQTTAAIQPQIVRNGALITENGRAYIDFAVNKGLGISNYNASLAFTAAVLKSDTSVFSGFHTIFDGSGVGVVQRNGGIVQGNETYFHHNVYPTAVWENGTALANRFNLASITTPFQVSIQNVGGLVSIGSIGNYDNGSLGGAAKQSETIVFSSVPSTTDRQTLERNQGAYYGITVA